MHNPLPQPDADELAHAARLAAVIAQAIAASGGALRFDRFMDLALYAPGLGYYSAGKTKFGAAGDFITAPELGPVFARCLADGVAPVLAADDAQVLELGAGSGALAADLLDALARRDALPTRYRILEISADLRERQRATIAARAAQFLPLIEWLDAPPAEPWRGVILGNEVIDALPARLFEQRASGPVELGVGAAPDAGFAWVDLPADPDFVAAIAHALGPRDDYPLPYRSELRTDLGDWLVAVTRSLDQGLALWIDYGYPRAEYYRAERTQGTLVCHYRHRAHADPLILVGLQDITAFVDFSQLAQAGRAAGFKIACYAPQAAFLAACGLERQLSEAPLDDALALARLGAQVRRLMLPGEMGERFKALALTRGIDPRTLPFHTVDQSARL